MSRAILKLINEQIDLSEWFRDQDTGDCFTNTLRAAFAEHPPDISLPFEWSPHGGDGRHGETPSDPVMLYVDLPLGGSDDTSISFGCSLEEVIDDLIDGACDPTTGKIVNDAEREMSGKIAARLRGLADKLDEACKP